MSMLRSIGGRAAKTLTAVILAGFAAFLISGTGATSARAGDLPFWERADAEKAAARNGHHKSSGYTKSSKSKYASSGKKKTYSYSEYKKPKLGGYAEQTEKKHKHKGVKVAALGNDDSFFESTKPKKSLSGGGVTWTADAGCLDGGLKSIVYSVAANYGPVTVNSTCRSHGHNAAVGGAPHSMHLSGNAVDFRVHGNAGAVYAYLKSNGSVGGLKHYGGGLFHIDNGERRSW
jgi:hypothetical protein